MKCLSALAEHAGVTSAASCPACRGGKSPNPPPGRRGIRSIRRRDSGIRESSRPAAAEKDGIAVVPCRLGAPASHRSTPRYFHRESSSRRILSFQDTIGRVSSVCARWSWSVSELLLVRMLHFDWVKSFLETV